MFVGVKVDALGTAYQVKNRKIKTMKLFLFSKMRISWNVYVRGPPDVRRITHETLFTFPNYLFVLNSLLNRNVFTRGMFLSTCT